MKKGNLFFLVLLVIVLIVGFIPLFNSMNSRAPVFFFSNVAKPFSRVYIPIIFLGIVEGCLLVLYIQSLLKDVKRQDATKFDLNK